MDDFIIHALDLRIGGFFCAFFRQDGKLVSIQLGKGDAEMVGDLLAGLWVWNNTVIKPVNKRRLTATEKFCKSVVG